MLFAFHTSISRHLLADDRVSGMESVLAGLVILKRIDGSYTKLLRCLT